MVDPPAAMNQDATLSRGRAVGCVSYLNAKPLIHGLADAQTRVVLDVPSRLVDRVLRGDCDVALCSVIDACRHPELVIVPVGGIGCHGPTWTVRLFSRVPIERIVRVHLDADSHTSVMLLRVLLAERFGVVPETVDCDFRSGGFPQDAEAVLLIGDKVVTSPPPGGVFSYTLDLGELWCEWTGGPFVFAAWLARRETQLGDLPVRLAARLEANLLGGAYGPAVEALLDRYADAHGWPRALARDYWTRVLRYRIGRVELDAVRRFAEACRSWIAAHPGRAAREGLGPVRDPEIACFSERIDATPAPPITE